MKPSNRLLRSLVAGPSLLLSASVLVVVAALLPDVLAWSLLALWCVLLAGVAHGTLESVGVALLPNVRPADAAQRRRVLEGVLRPRGADVRWDAVYIVRDDVLDGEALTLAGRRTVLCAEALMVAITTHRMPPAALDGVLVRAEARAEITGEGAIWIRLATWPARWLLAMPRAVAQRMRRSSWGEMAWRLRGVVLVGVGIPRDTGQPDAATALAVALVGLSYVMPWAEGELAARRASPPRGQHPALNVLGRAPVR